VQVTPFYESSIKKLEAPKEKEKEQKEKERDEKSLTRLGSQTSLSLSAASGESKERDREVQKADPSVIALSGFESDIDTAEFLQSKVCAVCCVLCV
jgi:hypothetical protein